MTAARERRMIRVSVSASAHEILGERPPGGELNAAMARSVVQVHRGTVGRGPRQARAFFRDNVFVVLLSEVMTRAEHTLVESGRRDAVVIGRNTLLETMRVDLIRTTEAATGCRVEHVLADTSPEGDMTAIVFILDRPVPAGNHAQRISTTP